MEVVKYVGFYSVPLNTVLIYYFIFNDNNSSDKKVLDLMKNDFRAIISMEYTIVVMTTIVIHNL